MKRNSAIKLLAKEMVMVIGALLEIKAKWAAMNNSQDLHTVSYIPDSRVKLNQLKKKKLQNYWRKKCVKSKSKRQKDTNVSEKDKNMNDSSKPNSISHGYCYCSIWQNRYHTLSLNPKFFLSFYRRINFTILAIWWVKKLRHRKKDELFNDAHFFG